MSAVKSGIKTATRIQSVHNLKVAAILKMMMMTATPTPTPVATLSVMARAIA